MARGVWALLVLVGLLAAAALATPEQIRLSLTDSPTEMVITWLSPATTDSDVGSLVVHSVVGTGVVNRNKFIAYSTQSSYSGSSMIINRVLLRDLVPNTRYRYFVCTGNSSHLLTSHATTSDMCSVPAHFNTRALGSHDTNLSLFGDMGTWDVDPFLAFLASSLDSHLFLHLGDLAYGKTEDVWNKWGNQITPISSQTPYMMLPGNWDMMDHSRELFYHRFFEPVTGLPEAINERYYYSLNYGSVHLVMLNSYEPYTAGSAQYAWLERDLTLANRNRAAQPFIVVCYHSPMYSSSAGHDGGDRAFQAAMEQLLADQNVDLCFSGHDHGYERSYPVFEGKVSSPVFSAYTDKNKKHPIHLLVGIGAATMDPWRDEQPAWSAVRVSMHGAVKIQAVTFPSPLLRVTAICQNGTVADEFTVTRPRARSAASASLPLLYFAAILFIPGWLAWPYVRRRFSYLTVAAAKKTNL